jgi:hypothetical protein
MWDTVDLHVHPREKWTWEEFLARTPSNSVALDGMVGGGPKYDSATGHINFDHHEGVEREATMSTCKQVYMAIKGGFFDAFREQGEPKAHVYINDPDQDTALAVIEMELYKMIEGAQSNPLLNRIVNLTDMLDITGGAIPLNLKDRLVRQHTWIFQPYTDMRKSGALSSASAPEMRNCIESVYGRLNEYLLNRGGEAKLDTRHKILHDSPFGYKIIHEIGGNDARYHLFQRGLNAFVSLVATRPDGRYVYTVGKRSRYVVPEFDVPELYQLLNAAEGLTPANGWNGSTLVGGSSRLLGSGLSWQQLKGLVDTHLLKKKKE